MSGQNSGAASPRADGLTKPPKIRQARTSGFDAFYLTKVLLRDSPAQENNIALESDPNSGRTSSNVSRRPSESDEEALLRRDGMQERPVQLKSPSHEGAFVLIMGAAQLIYAMMVGNVMMSLVYIQQDFEVGEESLPWFTGAFSVSMGAFVIIFGSLADHIGRKRVFIGGLAWLGIWALVGGFAPNITLFLIARAFQGQGCGALLPSAIGILGYIYAPGIRKNRVFSAFGSLAPVGFVVGGAQGGIMAQFVTWRASFWLSSAMAIALAISAAFIVPSDSHGEWSNIKDFDWLGSFLAVTSVVFVVFGFTEGPGSHWAPYTFALLAAGIVIFAAFLYSQKVVKNPIMPLEVWSTPSFKPLMLSLCIGWGSYFAWQFYASLFWLKVQKASPLLTTAYFTPNAVFGAVATLIAASTLHLLPGHYIFAISCLAFAVGPLLFALQPEDSIYWAFGFPAVSVATFGPDLSFSSASVFVTSTVHRRLQGTAGSLINTVTNIGGAVFIGLSGVIESQTNKNGQAMLTSYRNVWWYNLALAVLAALIVVFRVRIPKTSEKKHLE